MIAAVFLVAFALFVRTLAPSLSSGDTAEMLLSGMSLDVAHAPGYPLLAMLVRLALSLPAGGPAFRAGLVSAAGVAGACALLFAAVRGLSGSRIAGLFAAALFAVSPIAWEQATMIEKYGVQLFLAALALHLLVGGSARWLAGAFAFSLALGHHPMAVFLLPPLAVFAWRRLRTESPGGLVRAVSLAACLGLLPLSLRPVYAAIRADALSHAEHAGTRVINWFEPGRVRAWWAYSRLAPYAGRFDAATRVEAPTVGEHLAVYPSQLGWPGLAVALAGLAWLFLRSRPEAVGLAGVWLVSFPFNLRYLNPVSLVAVYHQTEILVLAMCAGLGLVALARDRRFAMVLAGAASLAWLAAAGHGRFPARDASRHYLLHDFNAAQIARIPPHGVFFAATNVDSLAVAYFRQAFGRRTDVVSMLLPHKEGPRHFVTRARYRSWVAELLPNALLDFTDEETGETILRRLVSDNRDRYCFFASGLSVTYLPPDLFVPAGLALSVRGTGCPAANPARGIVALRRASSRTWFAAPARVPVNRGTLDYWSLAYLRAAASTTDSGERLALLRTRTQVAPDDATTWGELAVALVQAGRRTDAEACFRRALTVDPGSIEGRLCLLRLLVARNDPAAVATHLHETFADSPLREASHAPDVIARLATGSLSDAIAAAHRAFAENALDRAGRDPSNPEYIPRRLTLLRLATELAPDWDRAVAGCVSALQDVSRWTEAAPYLDRLRALAPGDTRLDVRQGAGLLTDGRAADARKILLDAATRNPADPDAWLWLARAELSLNHRAEARRALGRFLALVPNAAGNPSVRALAEALAR